MAELFMLLAAAAFMVLIIQLDLPWLAILLLVGAILATSLLGFPHTLTLGLTTLLFALLAGRFCYLAIAEYLPVFRQLGKALSGRLLLQSLWRWSPVLLVVILVFVLINGWNQSLQQAVYALEAEGDYACQDQRPGSYLVCRNDPAFEQNMYAFAERFGHAFAMDRQHDFNAALDQLENTSDQLAQDLPQLIYQGQPSLNDGQPLYPAQLPAALQPPDCPRFIGWVTALQTCLQRSLLLPLNHAYDKVRADSETALHQELQGLDNDSRNHADAVRLHALASLERSSQHYQQLAHQTLELLFLRNSLGMLLLYAFSLYLLLKILSYIFTRFAFDPRQQGIPLAPVKPDHPPGRITACAFGNEVQLDLQQETWYAAKNRKVRYARKGRPVFPFPWHLLLRRLRTRTWGLYRFSPQDQSQQLELYANDVTHFILLTLQPGDRLCFALANLVAFSASLTLQSRFSLKMSVFFQHSLFFTVAEGRASCCCALMAAKARS
ncbi:MAG: hypothetical protein R3E95_18780 [Thiolinea sp.]